MVLSWLSRIISHQTNQASKLYKWRRTNSNELQSMKLQPHLYLDYWALAPVLCCDFVSSPVLCIPDVRTVVWGWRVLMWGATSGGRWWTISSGVTEPWASTPVKPETCWLWVPSHGRFHRILSCRWIQIKIDRVGLSQHLETLNSNLSSHQHHQKDCHFGISDIPPNWDRTRYLGMDEPNLAEQKGRFSWNNVANLVNSMP